MTITWPELIVLMAFGTGAEDRISGLIRTREVDPVPEDLADAEFEGTIEQHPSLGPVAVRENELRVDRRGQLVRLLGPDGRVTAIFGADTTWFVRADGVATEYDRRTSSFGWPASELVGRPSLSRWEGTDFTQVTGPIESTEFLGRPAWAFELAPPPHKPYPMQMTVDAGTGLVLRRGNRDFGSVSQWLSLALDADLPDDLFVWTGPTRSAEDERAERDAEHSADLAVRRAWLAQRGLAELPLPVPIDVQLHDWSDADGAFHASFAASLHGSVLRRPRSDEPWREADDLRWEHTYRWSDERWDWCLAAGDALDDAQLSGLRDHLARST